MTKRLIFALFVFLALTVAVQAADVTGKWVAQVPGRDGQTREVTFNFKVDGDKLTGTMSGRQGDIAISDGKISGDTISFVVTMERGGNTFKQTYTGTVSDNEIKFKRETGRGPATEFTAKRVQ
jgi:hypothetical protein